MKSFVLLFAGLLLIGISNAAISPAVFLRAEEQPAELSNESDELIFAHIIARHGARNIAKPYPNDPYKDEKHWPGGLGQLTNDGKVQHYKLGQYLRRRYKGLLGGEYSSKKVYIQSTDTDRTLMSAQANCAGLFPPKTDEERWSQDILWQPVPVHTTPHVMDHVLSGGKPCPKYDETLKQYMSESEEVQRIYKEHADLFKYWSAMSGANITTIPKVNDLFDTINIEKKYKKKIQSWAEKAIKPNGVMEYITKYSYAMYTNTKQLARLKGGFLLKDIIERTAQKVNSTLQPDRSLWLYIAHDYTISNILNGLGVFELHIPPYACSLHFELYKTTDNLHYLQLFYRSSEEENPSPLNLPGCGEKCPLNKFFELFNEIIPGDFETECALKMK